MDAATPKVIERFSLNWRIQHLMLIVSMTGLALTGLAYRYYDSAFGRFLIQLEGGFGARGTIHRWSAALLGVVAIFHIYQIVFTKRGHDDFLLLMPERGDLTRWRRSIFAKFSGQAYEPDWERYTLGQKIQYWMVGLGLIMMSLTGLILLMGHSAIAAAPKWVVDLIRVVHAGEGVELMVFLLLWHIYSTHFAPGNWPMDSSWIHGKIDVEKMKRLHPREYNRLFPDSK